MTDHQPHSFPLILSRLHIEGKSGTLKIREGENSYNLFLDKGRIVALSSTRTEESLSQMIINSGTISPWDVELAQEAVDAGKGRHLGSLLVDMGLVQQETIIDQLNKKLEGALKHLFNASRVESSFEEGAIPANWKIMPTKTTADLLLEGARAITSPIPIDEALNDPEKFVILSQDVKLRYQQAKTNKLEKQILHHAGRSPKINQIIGGKEPAQRMQLLQAIFGLVIAGLLDVSDKPARRDSLQLPETGRHRQLLSRSMVVEKFKNIGLQDPAEFLELSGQPKPDEIKSQYKRLLSLYHPDQSTRETLTDLTHQLEAIFLELTRCYNMITSGKKPQSVKQEVRQSDGSEAQVAMSDTIVKLKTASTNYQYATRKLSERKLGEAMSAMQIAVENEPGNAFYLFKLGQILRRIPNRQKEAELSYKRALDTDPLNTDIMSELASLYWENDMKSKAKTIMQQAFSIDPSNVRLQKLWNYLQVSERTFPLKEILLFIAGLVVGTLLGTTL